MDKTGRITIITNHTMRILYNCLQTKKEKFIGNVIQKKGGIRVLHNVSLINYIGKRRLRRIKTSDVYI